MMGLTHPLQSERRIKMQFVTDQKIDQWVAEHVKKCKSNTFNDAQFKYTFTPAGVIEVQEVQCICCGEERTVFID